MVPWRMGVVEGRRDCVEAGGGGVGLGGAVRHGLGALLCDAQDLPDFFLAHNGAVVHVAIAGEWHFKIEVLVA